jgi:hypothetical protein
VSGYEIVVSTADISPSIFGHVKALCPPGKRVRSYSNVGLTIFGSPDLNIAASFPFEFEGVSGWQVDAQNNFVFDSNRIPVLAVCASF